MIAIDLLRHGEPLGGRRYRGATDDPLSEKGWQQMETAVGVAHPWQRIITSPLSRCRDFALALGERHGIPVQEEERFTEIGFGDWEGLTAEQLRAQDPDCLRRFYHDPVANRPRGAEELASFVRRVVAAWQELLEKHCDSPLLIISHAGVMRVIIARLLGMPPENIFRLQIANAALVRIRGDGERPPALWLPASMS